MDVLELPRPVINFLRTISKEMHRYSLCWDIFGGSDSVTLTLTWKINCETSDDETLTKTRLQHQQQLNNLLNSDLIYSSQIIYNNDKMFQTKKTPKQKSKQLQHSKLDNLISNINSSNKKNSKTIDYNSGSESKCNSYELNHNNTNNDSCTIRNQKSSKKTLTPKCGFSRNSSDSKNYLKLNQESDDAYTNKTLKLHKPRRPSSTNNEKRSNIETHNLIYTQTNNLDHPSLKLNNIKNESISTSKNNVLKYNRGKSLENYDIEYGNNCKENMDKNFVNKYQNNQCSRSDCECQQQINYLSKATNQRNALPQNLNNQCQCSNCVNNEIYGRLRLNDNCKISNSTNSEFRNNFNTHYRKTYETANKKRDYLPYQSIYKRPIQNEKNNKKNYQDIPIGQIQKNYGLCLSSDNSSECSSKTDDKKIEINQEIQYSSYNSTNCNSSPYV